MPTIAELKKQRAELKDKAQCILTAAEATGEDLTENQQAKLEELLAKAEEVDGQIKAEEQRRERVSQLGARVRGIGANEPDSGQSSGARSQENEAIITRQHDRTQDDPNRGFRSSRDYFSAVMNAGSPHGSIDERLRPLSAVGSDEHRGNSNPDGGFLLPEAFSPNLLALTPDDDPTAGLVTTVPMSAPTVKIPARVDKDHSTSVSGGFRFYRRNEAETVTSSKAKLERVTLTVNDLMGISFATNELMMDSPISVAAIIEAGFQQEYGSQMLYEKLYGTGVGELEGVLNSPALVSVAKEGSQSADTILGLNVVKARARCWGYGNAIWLANPDCLPQLMSAHIAGTNGDYFLYAAGNGIDKPDTLLGRPIYFNEHLPTVGDLGDLLLGNWSQYLHGEYQRMEAASSIHVRFVYNESAFRITARNDGKCWWRSALTPKKGANTLSPFVAIAAR